MRVLRVVVSRRFLHLSLLSSSVVAYQPCRFFNHRQSALATTTTTTTTTPTAMNHHNSNGYHSDCNSDADSLAAAQSSSSSDNDDDHGKRIRLPVLKYGYRTEPMDWDELVDILTVQQDLAKMSRSVEQQRDYEVYKRDLLLEWSSVMDHVLCDKFPSVFEKRRQHQQFSDDPATAAKGKYAAHPPLSVVAASGTVHKALVRNDFPYFMVDGIEHWVLWKLGGICSSSDIRDAKSELRLKRGLGGDDDDDGDVPLLHWVNPPHLKSLPEIDHVHLLCKVVVALPAENGKPAVPL